MRSVTRITLLILFAAAGGGAAICVALVAIPSPSGANRNSATLSVIQTRVVASSALPHAGERPESIRSTVNNSLWKASDVEWTGESTSQPSPQVQAADERCSRAPLQNVPDCKSPKFAPAPSNPILPPIAKSTVAEIQTPALFYPSGEAEPIPSLRGPMADQIVRTQANGPISAGQSSPQPSSGAGAAPNSPAAKLQVADGMDELRKLLEASSAGGRGAESVAAPSPAGSGSAN